MRRKRPHGALAGLRAVLAARREKQKVKEDASTAENEKKDASKTDKQDKDSSETDKKQASSTTYNEDEGSQDKNYSSSTNNMITLVEDDDKVNLKAKGPPKDGTLEDKSKDDEMVEEEDNEEGEEDIAKDEVKEEANLVLKEVEPWTKNEANLVISEDKTQGSKAAPGKERQPSEAGIPSESERESEKVGSELLPVVKEEEKDEVGKEEGEEVGKGEENEKDERPPPFDDLPVNVAPITEDETFPSSFVDHHHHQSPTNLTEFNSTQTASIESSLKAGTHTGSNNGIKSSQNTSENTVASIEIFPEEFNVKSEHEAEIPFQESSKRESTPAPSDATLNRLTTTDATPTASGVDSLLDQVWSGQYGVSEAVLDDTTDSTSTDREILTTKSISMGDEEKETDAPPLAPSDAWLVDIWVTSSPSRVEFAPNMATIDPDAGLDSSLLAIDGPSVIHKAGNSSIVRVTDQFEDMQTNATHQDPTEKEENSGLENTSLPMFVLPSPMFSTESFDDETTQAASLGSISGITFHTTTTTTQPSIPGGPTSISGEAYSDLATSGEILDENLEVVTPAAAGTELFITNPTPTAESTNETDLLSASENGKYFDESTQFADLTGNLSTATHSIFAANGTEANLKDTISPGNGKGNGDLVVALPTGVVKAPTKDPELQIQQEATGGKGDLRPNEEKGEIVDLRPNEENGANFSSPFWVWPSAEDPWVWL